jgi:predicted RNase H-like HicB family nuclease
VIAREAAALAAQYQVILETEDGHWYGRGLEMPHVFGDGATPDKCVAATREALAAAVAYLLEQEQPPPAPARTGRRTQQVNVRLTAEEKAVIESTARRKGYSGLSDYLRATALESTGRE